MSHHPPAHPPRRQVPPTSRPLSQSYAASLTPTALPARRPPPASSYHVRRPLAIAGVVVAALGLTVLAQQQDAGVPVAADKGVAQVVERKGPEVEVAANGRAHVIVLFPDGATDTNGGGNFRSGGDVEVVLVEHQTPTAVEGQPEPQSVTTGREVVFRSAAADAGVVRYVVESTGNARKMMVLARVGGEYVPAQQQSGGPGVTVLTIQAPAKPQGEQPQQPADGQTAPQTSTPSVPAQAAIIMIYAGGAPS